MQSNRAIIVNYVLSWLASGAYRVWFWQNYKPLEAQRTLRNEWMIAAIGFDYDEVKRGLDRWLASNGIANPPTPDAFFSFIRPVLTDTAKAQLSHIHRLLSDGEQ